LNQPSLKDLVLGQAKINKNLTKKLVANDKILENINIKIEGLTSSVKNQLSFNKIFETQLAQLVAAIPINNAGKILRQPKDSLENVNAVTTRGGMSSHYPPNPNHIGKAKEHQDAKSLAQNKE
jgi:hypothetical protein